MEPMVDEELSVDAELNVDAELAVDEESNTEEKVPSKNKYKLKGKTSKAVDRITGKKLTQKEELTRLSIMGIIIVALGFLGVQSNKETSSVFNFAVWGNARESYNANSIWILIILVGVCLLGMYCFRDNKIIGFHPREYVKETETEKDSELDDCASEVNKEGPSTVKTKIQETPSVEESGLEDNVLDVNDIADRYGVDLEEDDIKNPYMDDIVKNNTAKDDALNIIEEITEPSDNEIVDIYDLGEDEIYLKQDYDKPFVGVGQDRREPSEKSSEEILEELMRTLT